MNYSFLLNKGLFPTLVFVIFILLAGKTTSVDPFFNKCNPQRCGSGPNVSYPFWIQDEQPSYCGYPGFNLTCEDENLHLKMSQNDFLVRNIFHENQTVLLVDTAYLRDRCPSSIHNLTLDRTPFQLGPTETELYFFLNCSSQYLAVDPLGAPFSCISHFENLSYATIYGEKVLGSSNFPNLCESWAKVPIMGENDPKITANELYLYGNDFYNLFAKGFLLNWKGQNCDDCVRTGGQCGYNLTESAFICFCSDRPHKVKCSGIAGKDNKRIIAIGVSCGVGSFFLACLLSLFLVQRYLRRRRRLAAASSTLLSSNVSPDPSSKHHDLEKSTSTLYTHIFSYTELEEATDNFDASRELGDGGFGTVYFGKLRDGRSVAVKRLYENNYRRVEQFMNEVKILSSLRHPNLVTLYGCTSRHSRELLLVYEFVPNGTVADHIHGERAEKGALTWPVRMSIAIETAEALAYLHGVEPPIIHRDVKTNNILLDNNFHVKVADFGLSRLFPLDVTHVSTTPQGTPGYVDPDYHKCYQLTDKSDVYSFGVVLIELISSKPAVDITRHRHEINLASMALNKIHSGALHELVDLSLGFESDFRARRMITMVAELAYRCLQEEKETRPPMEEVAQVLRGIAREENGMARKPTATQEMELPKDDVGLLEKMPPPSPDSVMDNWGSHVTTPNIST